VATVLHIPAVSKHLRGVFDEIRRVLKPGGRLAVIECKKEKMPFGPPKAMRLSPDEIEHSIGQGDFKKLGMVDLGYNCLLHFGVVKTVPDDFTGQTTVVQEKWRKIMNAHAESPCPSGEATNQIALRPVGIVRNTLKEPFLRAGERGIEASGEMDEIKAAVRESYDAMSDIIIKEEMIQLLDGIEKYSHLVVLYWGHKVPESSRLLTRVHPMGRKENPLVGIFSTCSPARPNPLLMSVVRLERKEENVLQVSDLDAVDGSPVIDIKPYVREFYPQSHIRIPEWMQKICDEMKDCYP
jgi:tRNA-Thr(GGU) m(6)t(6)A37 methyltransferase TsaA